MLEGLGPGFKADGEGSRRVLDYQICWARDSRRGSCRLLLEGLASELPASRQNSAWLRSKPDTWPSKKLRRGCHHLYLFGNNGKENGSYYYSILGLYRCFGNACVAAAARKDLALAPAAPVPGHKLQAASVD